MDRNFLCAEEIATISACRVTSRSFLTILSDSQMNSPRRPMTAANGYSLLEPADCARATQRRIIAISDASVSYLVMALTFAAQQTGNDDLGICPVANNNNWS